MVSWAYLGKQYQRGLDTKERRMETDRLQGNLDRNFDLQKTNSDRSFALQKQSADLTKRNLDVQYEIQQIALESKRDFERARKANFAPDIVAEILSKGLPEGQKWIHQVDPQSGVVQFGRIQTGPDGKQTAAGPPVALKGGNEYMEFVLKTLMSEEYHKGKLNAMLAKEQAQMQAEVAGPRAMPNTPSIVQGGKQVENPYYRETVREAKPEAVAKPTEREKRLQKEYDEIASNNIDLQGHIRGDITEDEAARMAYLKKQIKEEQAKRGAIPAATPSGRTPVQAQSDVEPVDDQMYTKNAKVESSDSPASPRKPTALKRAAMPKKAPSKIKVKVGEVLPDIPAAKGNKNAVIKDPKTGTSYRSNGKEWVKIQ